MPKTKISEYSATANSNTDVASINIDEGCAPSGINNAIRAVMGHLKDFQQGTNGDPFNGPVNGTVGATTPSTGAFTSLTTTGTINLITVGRGAGAVSTNTAVGASALAANTSGSNQTAVGKSALASNTTGIENSAFGVDALTTNTTGNYNVAIGLGANKLNTTGSNNTSLGYLALLQNTTASNNTAVGYQSIYTNTTGAELTAIGNQALQKNTTANWNIAVGSYALRETTTGASNTAIGYSALQLNTTASYNTAVGYQAGYSQTTSTNNTFVGYQCGYSVTTGTGRHTFVGINAGFSNSTGTDNIAIGYYAGYTNQTGNGNVCIGSGLYGVSNPAGYAATGSQNTFIGGSAGSVVTTGSKNTIIGNYNGNQGGLDIRTASNYIVLSDGDGNINAWCNPANGKTWVFGNSAVTQNPNEPIEVNGYGATTQYCYFASATVNTYSGYAMRMWSKSNSSVVGSITFNTTSTTYNTSSDYRLKDITGPISGDQAKDFVMALQPKQGTWKTNGSPFAGFVAHEFAEVSPSSVVGEKDAVDENGNPVMQAMQASSPEVMANLVALVQKIVTDNEQLKAEVDSLKAQINGASA